MQLGNHVNSLCEQGGEEQSVTSLYTFLQLPCGTVWLQALLISPSCPGLGTVLEVLGSGHKAGHRDSQQSDL